MSTFTNITKNAINPTNETKNVETFTNTKSSHELYFILTDLSDYVLVGEDSDEILIWDEPTSYKNLIKS